MGGVLTALTVYRQVGCWQLCVQMVRKWVWCWQLWLCTDGWEMGGVLTALTVYRQVECWQLCFQWLGNGWSVDIVLTGGTWMGHWQLWRCTDRWGKGWVRSCAAPSKLCKWFVHWLNVIHTCVCANEYLCVTVIVCMLDTKVPWYSRLGCAGIKMSQKMCV